MRTRRSPRNQMIMWRELGGKAAPLVPIDPVAEIERFLADPFISLRGRRKAERDLLAVKRRLAFRAARQAA